jgi:hypothetical protein
MPTARAYWKGHLKLSLVTCPVALYPRVKSIGKDPLPSDQSKDWQSPSSTNGR